MKMKFAVMVATLILAQPAFAQSNNKYLNTSSVKVGPSVMQRVDINRANVAQLTKIKGLGKVKAQAIIDYRKANGKFSSVEELTAVKGIGKKALKKLKPLLKV